MASKAWLRIPLGFFRLVISFFRLRNAVRVRLIAMALGVSGILFVLYPAIRPFSDEASLQGAEAFASSQWILAHVLAILGFMLMTLGLLGVYIAGQHALGWALGLISIVHHGLVYSLGETVLKQQ